MKPSKSSREEDLDRLTEQLVRALDADPDFDEETFLRLHSDRRDILQERLKQLRGVGLLRCKAPISVPSLLFERGLDVPQSWRSAIEADHFPASPPSDSRIRLIRELPTTLEDRYRFEEVLGRGGMGTVVRAFDRHLERQVALKFARLPEAESEHALGRRSWILQRFVHEAQINGQLEHPNIVPIHELATSRDGTVFFVMQLISGKSMREWLNEAETFAPATRARHAVSIVLGICKALAFAHSKGIVHRDLKPTNVMVGSQGEVQVMDWGLAKRFGTDAGKEHGGMQPDPTTSSDSGSPELSLPGEIFGTPTHMSPEQALGEVASIGPWTDVFGIGSLLFHLLCGKPPFPADTRKESLDLAKEAAIDYGRLRRVPRELVFICRKAMARLRNERYGSVADLALDLEAYLGARTGTAWRDGPIAVIVKSTRRHPAVAASLLGVLIITALAILLARFRDEAKDQEVMALERGQQIRDQDFLKKLGELRVLAARLPRLEYSDRFPSRVGHVAACEKWIKAYSDFGIPMHLLSGDEVRARIQGIEARNRQLAAQFISSLYTLWREISEAKLQLEIEVEDLTPTHQDEYERRVWTHEPSGPLEIWAFLPRVEAILRKVDGRGFRFRVLQCARTQLTPEPDDRKAWDALVYEMVDNAPFGEEREWLGIMLARFGRRDDVIRCMQLAIEADPTLYQAHLTLGSYFARSRDSARAAAHCLAACSLLPKSVEAHIELGNAWLQLGSLDDALKAYSIALEFAPDSAVTRLNVALAKKQKAFNQNDPTLLKESLVELDRICIEFPSYPLAFFNRAAALDVSDRHGEAYSSAESALQLQLDRFERLRQGPDLQRCFQFLHYVLELGIAEHKYPEVLEWDKKARNAGVDLDQANYWELACLAQHGTGDHHEEIAMYLRQIGKDARSVLRQHLTPGNQRVGCLSAACARQAYEQALLESPESDDLRYCLAKFLIREAATSEAIDLVQSLLDQYTDSTDGSRKSRLTEILVEIYQDAEFVRTGATTDDSDAAVTARVLFEEIGKVLAQEPSSNR